MKIVMENESGEVEEISVFLEAGIVFSNGRLRPGYMPDCLEDRDYFLAALNEGKERSGVCVGEDGASGFSWRLEGDEGDDCLSLMLRWKQRLGDAFHPYRDAADYVDTLTSEEVGELRDDLDVWSHFLEDPAALLHEHEISTRRVSP